MNVKQVKNKTISSLLWLDFQCMYCGVQSHAQIDADFDTRVGVVRPLAAEAAVLLRDARESNKIEWW